MSANSNTIRPINDVVKDMRAAADACRDTFRALMPELWMWQRFTRGVRDGEACTRAAAAHADLVLDDMRASLDEAWAMDAVALVEEHCPKVPGVET